MWCFLFMLLLTIFGSVLILLSQHRLQQALFTLVGVGHLRYRRLYLLWLPAMFFIAALFFGLLAFFRLGNGKHELAQSPPQLYVLLDCSLSMTAEALPGESRLAAAKRGLRSLPAVLPGWELSLLTFAGDALLDFPPSSDHFGWLAALASVSPESPPWSGSSPAAALQLAAESSSFYCSGTAAILLISDGEINVEKHSFEELLWRQRTLPCLFVPAGKVGETKSMEDASGWLAAMFPADEAVSTVESEEIMHLLALSKSPFLFMNGKAALDDTALVAENLGRLLQQNLSFATSAEKAAAKHSRLFILLSALFALLSAFSSERLLPRLNFSLPLSFFIFISVSLPAGERDALELCRQAVLKSEAFEEVQQALELYRQALRLCPGLPLAARNLEYTLLQQETMISSRQNDNLDSEGEEIRPSEKKTELGGGTASLAENTSFTPMAAGEISEAAQEKWGSWRDLQLRQRKVFRPPPKCKPW